MITKRKKKSSRSMLVFSMICAIVITIVGQSINNHTLIYAGQLNDVYFGGQNKNSDLQAKEDLLFNRPLGLVNKIDDFLKEKKKMIDFYVLGNLHDDVIDQKVIDINNKVGDDGNPDAKNEQEQFMHFSVIKKSLLDKRCEYISPIDNVDPQFASHVQWGLDHCLITVSSGQKVYANNFLTHEMMRTIAKRAGFFTVSEYNKNKTVSEYDLLSFFDALQQHHHLGDLPVLSVGDTVTRGEYIRFLHMIFDKEDIKQNYNEYQIQTGSTHIVSIASDKEENSVDENTHITKPVIGVDKQMLKNTVSWLIDKI